MQVPMCGDRGRPVSAHEGQVLVAAQGVALTLTGSDVALLTQAWRVSVGHCSICLSCPLLGGSERLVHQALVPLSWPSRGLWGRPPAQEQHPASARPPPPAPRASLSVIHGCLSTQTLFMASNAGMGAACSLPGTF